MNEVGKHKRKLFQQLFRMEIFLIYFLIKSLNLLAHLENIFKIFTPMYV